MFFHIYSRYLNIAKITIYALAKIPSYQLILLRDLLLFGFILSGCAGVSSSGIFGTGVSVAIDPRSIGTQIDDSLMQKNLTARILMMNKNYLLSVKSKVLDGRIFLTGKVDEPEEKLKLTKTRITVSTRIERHTEVSGPKRLVHSGEVEIKLVKMFWGVVSWLESKITHLA